MKRLIQNDACVTFLILLAYLCTNSYIYGWDDQHLEIPLLKHLIDPVLYKGDYYVEGLAKNFSSYLYPILAKIIRLNQIPAAYLILFLLSRYAMFYWVYKLWQWIAGNKWQAFLATVMFFLLGRTEEFLYRTFSHQEFSYIFMFPGLYYFYRERFILAAFLFGVGANFNAIYNLYPMLYLLGFLLVFRRDRWPMIFKTGFTFTAAALPFLLWQIPRMIERKMTSAPVTVSDWMPLYLISCQQNFLFWTYTLKEALKGIPFIFSRLEPYLFLLVLYGLLCVKSEQFRRDSKMHAIMGVSYLLILVSFFFSYIHPNRTMIDLNLLRTEQFVRFFLMGYMTIIASRYIQQTDVPWKVLLAGILFCLVGFGEIDFLWLRIQKYALVFILFAVLFIWFSLKPQAKYWSWLKQVFIVAPLLASFIHFSIYHYDYLKAKAHGTGFWQLNRNWVDMQNYVRRSTPKDALILTPHDTETGGFRIFSERKVLVCYRDCGVVGFDYNAAVEWHKRIQDIEEFRVYAHGDISRALFNAIVKYKVDYIVFMNYYQPKTENPVLRKLYQNEVFALYKVVH